jgi:diadenosine tetraphosphatase ApaH/serine/threonine PP2A family protein phosphatase
MEPASRDPYEELEGTLDPHRKEERDAAVAEVTARLRSRGVTVSGAEPPDDLANLLTAVERFEAAVEAHGGDLMVDDLKSQEPDDRHFVLPRRGKGEAVRAYMGRIDDATARLRRHPRRAD